MSPVARFRPCIDIHKGQVKQIVGGSLSDSNQMQLKTNFESTRPSSWYAQLYQKHDLKGGHVIMLGRDDDTRQAARDAVQAWPGGLQVGGGITPANAMEWLDAGASHVIVTSYVFVGGELLEDRLKELVNLVSKSRLVLDLSCRSRDGAYYVVTDRWQKFTQLQVTPETLMKLSGSCDEYLVHGVDVEGLQLGVDEKLVQILADGAEIPVTYAGGVSNMDNIQLIQDAGKGQIDYTVGSALDIFGGKLKFDDVVKVSQQKELGVST